MRKYFWFVALLGISLFAKAQRPGAAIDVQHYAIAIELSDEQDLIKCTSAITVLFLKDTSTVTFDLIAKQTNGKGMTATSVTENGQSRSFQHYGDSIAITLGSVAKTGSTRTLTISYEGVPADGLIIEKNKYQRRGFFADNWPNRARHWMPCIDHPSDKATVDFTVTAPDHFQVVANGIQAEETSLTDHRKTTRYQETVAISTKIMVIGAADFAVQRAGQVDCIPVYSWIYPEDKDKGFYDYAQALDILPWFIQRVGPYAFAKLANVQSKTIFGGMENAGAIFYAENSVKGNRSSEALITHEIAHQWFGDMATETDWPHLWLSEGFATYMTILYFEQQHGQDTARYMRRKDREQVINFSKEYKRPVVDTAVKDYMQLLNANSYQKGGWVLHMLRRKMGDTLFWKGIRNYYERYKGKNASTDDLQKVMEATSGQHLSRFFRQWLFTPGQPMLNITWQYDAGRKQVKGTISQLQETPFEFPLQLTIKGNNNKTINAITVPVTSKQATFTIPAAEAPTQLIPDEEVNLLFESTVKRSS